MSHHRRAAAALMLAPALVLGGLTATTAAEARPATSDLLPPVAQGTATPANAALGETVTFSAEDSFDGDVLLPGPLTYAWDFGDGSAITDGVVVTHAYDQPGTYAALVTVTDDEGFTDTAETPVTVTADNTAPTAEASATPQEATVGEQVLLSAAGSTDLENRYLLTYAWDLGDGATATTRDVKHAYAAPGTYAATVTVTDPDGAQDTATAQVKVVAANTAPTAVTSYSPNAPLTGQRVRLSGAGTTDSENPYKLTYAWDFGDGGTSPDATTRDASVVYTTVGTYPVTFTVTDPDGATTTDSFDVTVRPSDQRAPRTRLLVSPAMLYADRTTAKLSGELSSDNETPSKQLTYAWRITGPDELTSSQRKFRHVFETPGKYRIGLRTTDEVGNTSWVAKRVRVWRWRDCQDRTARIDRDGGWSTVSGRGADGDHCRGEDGSTFRYRFSGPRLEIGLGRGSLGGRARVYVDGERRKGLNFHTDDSLRFGKTRVIKGLGKGKHTVRLETRGGLAFLDTLVSQG